MPRFTGLTNTDFEALAVPTLEGRMEAIKAGPHPKLEALGGDLAPALADLLGHPVYPIVAKHLRRRVNPPSDTWVALSPNPRGYKMAPHFEVGLWPTHAFIQTGLIYEAPDRAAFGALLLERQDEIRAALPGHFRWLEDSTQPQGILHREMTETDFARIADRLMHQRQSDCMVGVSVDRPAAVATGPRFAEAALKVMQTLLPIYRLASLMPVA